MEGGTFNRRLRIFFWRWRRTYAGHRTMRDRLRWGWMSWPIPKFLGRFSRRGFCLRQSLQQCGWRPSTYLGGLLGAGLALREGRGRRFLGLGCHLIVEAVIERETISECSFTK
jgi:hypothetical protein